MKMKLWIPVLLFFFCAPVANAATDNAPLAADAPPRYEAEAEYTHESLDKGYQDWRAAWLRLQERSESGDTLYGGIRQTNRFSLADDEYQIGFVHPLAAPFSLAAELSLSPTHNVFPRWSGFAEVDMALSGWVLAAGYRRTEYDQSQVNMGSFRVERYWGDLRGAYTFYPVTVENAGSVSSHAFRVDWYYADRSFIGAGYAIGSEVENTGAAGLLSSDITEYLLTGRHYLMCGWLLIYEAGTHRQSPFYTRNWLSLGIGRTF